MTRKVRIPIPNDIAAEILFMSDRTCCVCNERGKQVQIHHIDENPANNDLDNLSVLCFDCHDQTMIKGGFGRKLEAFQIIKYRNEWNERVKGRKTKADEIASIQTVTGSSQTVTGEEMIDDYLFYKTNDDPKLLKDYLEKILIVQQAQLIIAQTKWDLMTLDSMIQGSNDMVDFYEEVLIELSTFYPKGHFNDLPPKKYFSEMISSRFIWHRLIIGTQAERGTIVFKMRGENVIKDLKNMVVNMVTSLRSSNDREEQNELQKWTDEWLK